ncbi:MAG TPA: hypothetical protein VJA85_02435 [Candidatus Limnocylindria bacterium]|nr:hypothetical protein [Candidatus Limnocylindria bacterium]
MSPWPVLVALLAAINLGAFITIRGRWGRLSPVLALAAVVGAALGEAIGGRTGLEVWRIGDFGAGAASVGAQLAMLTVVLLSNLGPSRRDEPSAPR